ncbi:MAG: folate family ECF transporter S component [Clostridia bacterium]
MAIKTRDYTKKLAYIAILTALACIFNYFTFFVNKVFSISFTMIPTFVAGVFIGPIGGFLVGFLGDFLVGMIFPQGAYLITVGIASGLFGLIPGLVFKYIKLNAYVKIVISFALEFVICTLAINTTTFWVVYSMAKGKSYWVYLWGRFPFQLANTAINMALCCCIYAPMKKLFAVANLYKRKVAQKAQSNVNVGEISVVDSENIVKMNDCDCDCGCKSSENVVKMNDCDCDCKPNDCHNNIPKESNSNNIIPNDCSTSIGDIVIKDCVDGKTA